MLRGPLGWVLAVAGGVLLVILVSAAIGGRDESGEPVTAGEWAQNVCGTVSAWRGEMEAIVDGARVTGTAGTAGTETGAPTPEGKRGSVRRALERGVRATETMVGGIERAGIPQTAEGEEAAERLSDWADSASDGLEEAQDALDEDAESLEEAAEQLAQGARAIGAALASGVQTLVEVARLDPELGAALREASTCEALREEGLR